MRVLESIPQIISRTSIRASILINSNSLSPIYITYDNTWTNYDPTISPLFYYVSGIAAKNTTKMFMLIVYDGKSF